jgi:hypothetical protein
MPHTALVPFLCRLRADMIKNIYSTMLDVNSACRRQHVVVFPAYSAFTESGEEWRGEKISAGQKF